MDLDHDTAGKSSGNGAGAQGQPPGVDAVAFWVSDRSSALSRLGFSGTSATDAEWLANMEHAWRLGIAPEMERLHKRARGMRKRARDLADSAEMVALEILEAKRSELWASSRASSVARARVDAVSICGRRWITTRCACGPRERRVGCDIAWICERCAAVKRRRLRGRMTRALKAISTGARRATHGRARTYMITLTGPHVEIGADTERIKRAWREISKRAAWLRRGYVGVVEATGGSRDDGHVHLHVGVVAEWIPYAELHAAWDKAMGHVGCNVEVTLMSVTSASEYLAKYATKGCHIRDMPGDVAGRFLVSMRGRRAVFCSRGFWQPHTCRCAQCASPVKLISAPSSFAAVSREGEWLALAERNGVRLARGSPQARLAIVMPAVA